MTRRTLVLGGARSGKSAHAEGLLAVDEPATYVATARRDPTDAEWAERIAKHEAQRPETWHTVEPRAPNQLRHVLESARPTDPPLLVDDLGTWLTGLLDDEEAWQRCPSAMSNVADGCDKLIYAAEHCQTDLVLVSAEVGLGLVPSTSSGRLFRDELGALNARLARACHDVVLLVAGVPLSLR